VVFSITLSNKPTWQQYILHVTSKGNFMGRKKQLEKDKSSSTELLTMDEAIERLQTTRPTFYRWLRSGRITGTKAGGQWRFSQEDIDRFLKGIGPKIGLRTDITPLLQELEKRLAAGKIKIQRDTNAPVQTAFNMICALADQFTASDIHIDRIRSDFDAPTLAHLRFRIDGVLSEILSFDERLIDPIIEQIKLLSGLNVLEKNRGQSGTISGYEVAAKVPSIDARVNIVPAGFGESLTMRILRPNVAIKNISLDKINLKPDQKALLLKHLHGQTGMILFTGASGSGKTTTLYSALRTLASPNLSVMSVEDPVELPLPWVVQIRVNKDAGFGFFEGLQSIMRSDPDVIMVGEFPDVQSIDLALKAAMTGHIVLATSHAPDALSALSRLRGVMADAVVVTEGIKLIVAQRLFRKLCNDCAEPAFPDKEEHPSFFAALRAETEEKQIALLRNCRGPKGCQTCGGTGYRGRLAVYELLELTNPLKEAIRGQVDDDLIKELLAAQKFQSLTSSAIDHAIEGNIYFGEI